MTDAKALRARLSQFAARHSRAEIARKTGTSVMNVSRYLKGTRVPAEFCMALVREFGVNPSWLLAGQGGPFVSDLATQHGQMAGNLLELVEAMSAVTKMRLGSIAGQSHMKLLRQLNDSLGTYERLRTRLNEQSRDILSEMLQELEAALAEMDMARAGALRKAAEQVARLCDDEALGRRLLGMQAHHSYLSGRIDDALALMRKRFVQSIGGGRIETEDQAQGAMRLVVVLNDSGEIDEALRMGRAFLELAGPDAETLPSIAGIGAFCGHILTARGEVREALPVLDRWLPLQSGRQRAVSQAVLVRAQLLAGIITFEEALSAPGLPAPKHAHILGVACAMEDAGIIRACMKFVDSAEGHVVKERVLTPHVAPLIARCLERADRRVLREFDSVRKKLQERPGSELELDVIETQLFRLLGDRKRGVIVFNRIDKDIAKLPSPQVLDVGLRISHERNRIAFGKEGEAFKNLRRLLSDGCRLLAPLFDA